MAQALEDGGSPAGRQHPGGRRLVVFGTVGLLTGATVGVWLLVTYLWPPPPPRAPGLETLQDAETIVSCEGFSSKEAPPAVAPRTVSFRINKRNFLLEVQINGTAGWLLACHAGWSALLGTRICQALGHIRLTHHKGVNLTDVPIASTQAFARVLPGAEPGLEEWQPRGSCPSGQIVSLKCSECGAWPLAARIVGGHDAPQGRWPWQASLFLGSRHMCGGTVLAPRWVVTAAHCMDRLTHRPGWRVIAGLVTRALRKPHTGAVVEEITLHPQYSPRSHDYDIALLRLQTPLNFSNAVGAVCLPKYQQNIPWGTGCWVSGWGHTATNTMPPAPMLQDTLVPLISTSLCNSSRVYAGEITARMLCAGYLDGKADACQGDSGGPLVCPDEEVWRLVGIVSWGRGCAEPNHPGVYAKVTEFLDWIHGTMWGD
ncbi:transmembrane protease serine 5 [Tachyglossus aculeatus]|uniref:transmembrane protease serine 5 n=1 Tax=Tachyglossus aculeatus TaxID=9261 RepID=UPI0018F7B2D4|nr:transmembrane protease serine 5 [Tachyglossus aculeatus]